MRTYTYTNLASIYILLHTSAIWYSLLLLGYEPVQRVTVVNIVRKYSTMVLYYNLMGPPSHMRSVVDRNVVMRRIPIIGIPFKRGISTSNKQCKYGLSWTELVCKTWSINFQVFSFKIRDPLMWCTEVRGISRGILSRKIWSRIWRETDKVGGHCIGK